MTSLSAVLRRLFLPGILLGLSVVVFAQEDPVHVALQGPELAVAPGQGFSVSFDVTIDSPYHVYDPESAGGDMLDPIRTEISGSTDREDVSFISSKYPGGAHDLTVDYGGGILETYQVLSDSFSVQVFFEVAESAEPGPGEATLLFTYQACDDQVCFNPHYDEPFTVAFEIAPDGKGGIPLSSIGALAQPSGEEAAQDMETRLLSAMATGDVITVLLLSVMAGLLALLTPCVFPMIPITVSFFTKRAETAGGKGAPRYAIAYGLGIVATYTAFGLLLALAAAGAAQDFATNPWVNLFVAALFIYFGLSLLGFYEMKPPRFLTRVAAGGGLAGREGYLPVIAMGFVFTITAFTCTAPVVGALLAGFSRSGDPAFVVLSMLGFSTAFALPFVLLALFPNSLSRLPDAGGWMVTVKATMGFVELIASLKFLSNTDIGWNLIWLPRSTMLVLTLLLLAALALYLLGAYRLPHDGSARVGFRPGGRSLAGLLVVASMVYMSRGLGGALLHDWVEAYLPPGWYGLAAGEVDDHELVDWRSDLEKALVEAEANGGLVFIDFTGIFCVNCRQVENKIFRKEAFAQAVENTGVIPVQLFTDRRDPETHDLAEEDAGNRRYMEEVFGTVTLPLYALLSPEGKILRRMPMPAMVRVDDFIDFLEDPRDP